MTEAACKQASTSAVVLSPIAVCLTFLLSLHVCVVSHMLAFLNALLSDWIQAASALFRVFSFDFHSSFCISYSRTYVRCRCNCHCFHQPHRRLHHHHQCHFHNLTAFISIITIIITTFAITLTPITAITITLHTTRGEQHTCDTPTAMHHRRLLQPILLNTGSDMNKDDRCRDSTCHTPLAGKTRNQS
jgi:hypothetical protein